jgi:hypothetical protein
MEQFKTYFTKKGWDKDWKNTKELYKDGLVKRIIKAVKTYDREMCNNNWNYRIPTLTACAGTLTLGYLVVAGAIIIYMQNSRGRNPDAFDIY